MLMAGIFTELASALRKESSKKPCTIQLHYENSALIISDFGQKSDRYVYQRFQFRKQHLVKSMKAIGLLTKKLRSTRNWSWIQRHFFCADTAMSKILSRMASQCSLVYMMRELDIE